MLNMGVAMLFTVVNNKKYYFEKRLIKHCMNL
jgi:hypothetical protein